VSEETPQAQATEAQPEPETPQAIKIKIGKVREFMACTVKQRGCKSPSMGNVFPVDHVTGNLSKPFALACSVCLTKMQDDGQWVVP
jgi:hypothetical protein